METGAIAGADGQLYAAIQVAEFGDIRTFRTRVDTVVRQIRTSRRTERTEALHVPGAIERQRRRTTTRTASRSTM
ncbi:MAG: hypothetical protein OXE86_13745 [Alphaproteobacteria bacterium]|nr:hypothetical protein [Alphaproteobacteria bacterium]